MRLRGEELTMLLNARWFFGILIIICIIFLVSPMMIRERSADDLLMGSDSYKTLRFADDMQNGNSLSYDELSYNGRDIVEEKAWYYLASLNPKFMIRFLPVFFGVLSLLFFYLLVSKIKPDIKGLASLLLISSPAFIYLFSTASKYTAAVFFIILGSYLFKTKKNLLSYISFFAAGLFSVFSLFLVVLVFFYYALKSRKYKNLLIIFIEFAAVFFISFYKIFTLGFPEIIFGFGEFSMVSFMSFIFFGFGNQYGTTIFFLFLSLIGIFAFYKEKYKFLFIYILLIILFLSAFYANFLLFYISFALSFFTALGFMVFLKYEWRENSFKFLTILILCCGLLFSFIVFYDNAGDYYPSSSHHEAAEFLTLQDKGVVFSSLKNGKIINYAGKPNFMDDDFAFAPNPAERWIDMKNLFETKDITAADELMKKYNIKYILIDKETRKEFNLNDEQGLLFLMKYTPQRFSLVFDKGDIEIWSRIEIT